jgi:hypothetical protein
METLPTHALKWLNVMDMDMHAWIMLAIHLHTCILDRCMHTNKYRLASDNII